MGNKKQVKGWVAVFDNMDGSFDPICWGEVNNGATEESIQRKVERNCDNERVRVYPYYTEPFEVL